MRRELPDRGYYRKTIISSKQAEGNENDRRDHGGPAEEEGGKEVEHVLFSLKVGRFKS